MFVGSASSHYSAVAGMLRLLRARPSSSASSSPSPSPPPIYADEGPLSQGTYSVGLLHAANLRPDADAAGKADRWRVAARRLVESIPLARWPTAAREVGQSSTAACDAHVLRLLMAAFANAGAACELASSVLCGKLALNVKRSAAVSTR